MNRLVLATFALIAVAVGSAFVSPDTAQAVHGHGSCGFSGPVRGVLLRGHERRAARRAGRQEHRASRHASCGEPASYAGCSEPAAASCAEPVVVAPAAACENCENCQR